jgi:isopropylmalate/homocitrate/citramalate synthase
MPSEDWGELLVGPQVYTASLALPDPAVLKIYDTTLRDGEQMPGVALSPRQKYSVACEVSRLGCHIIDLCFPLNSPSERELLRLTSEGRRQGEIRKDLEVLVMCRASLRDVDQTIECVESAGFSLDEVTFLLFTSASSLHVKYKLGAMLLQREGLRPDDVADLPLSFFHQANARMIGEIVRYAAGQGVTHIEFGAEDASRTPLELLIDLVQAAVTAGASRYVFADTTGSLSPEAARHYCAQLTAAFPGIERVCHFHNDFDLATANTIAAVLNGFTTFTTTLNGLGERAGNAPLHSVVVALKYLYGIEIPGFLYQRLGAAKQLVEELTGIPVQVTEPVIGRNVFSHESGIHTHGVGICRRMYEPIPYQEVGGEARFVYGKHSGTSSLMRLLAEWQQEIGCKVDSEFVQNVLDAIKELRTTQIAESETSQFIRQYYANLDRLGFSESEVVEVARTVANGPMQRRCSA